MIMAARSKRTARLQAVADALRSELDWAPDEAHVRIDPPPGSEWKQLTPPDKVGDIHDQGRWIIGLFPGAGKPGQSSAIVWMYPVSLDGL